LVRETGSEEMFWIEQDQVVRFCDDMVEHLGSMTEFPNQMNISCSRMVLYHGVNK
jgi:hypothetical protein